MIELQTDELRFSSPEVHSQAVFKLVFERTLRIPDDDRDYPLPPGLGQFPLRHVDDFAANLPPSWLEHGGVMLPMYQAEAMWLSFDAEWIADRDTSYPFAIKVAAGKINAASGAAWSDGLHRGPQDYLVVPGQPWLDGFCVEKGIIRQFVAMPLGAGYTAEEQLTGRAEHGGLQVIVYPMRREVFERRFPKRRRSRGGDRSVVACLSEAPEGAAMGLAPGGRMRQEIFEDPYELQDWDLEHGSRCFVHLANSMVWREITGQAPPTVPPTAREYTKAGLPWFEYYDESAKALPGSDRLARLKSVLQLGQQKGEVPLPENAPVAPEHLVTLRGLGADQVREGRF